ncbi:MAG: hypothetical protein E5Y51_05585 [Mesorhizobium sp.]|uniref:hypothetical protein n=1 Tax=Mesorhizobium sp. M1A.F.Ca.IN.022.06.1.1 TaxID=2493680 RepID=UPI000F751B65|nr:hypothetical protein [Mesorhizobium sp. M1A.F.Ca.IN.022.06.1.1]AZO61222.1 hypothetical protein EJ078_19655 [Mesorhizobium sp. M1A.F.Ca.IN.022.06.1.1]TIN19673.1 MAG: hypothetical protein E5Y51_05585 [Mesorhizobium sp.]
METENCQSAALEANEVPVFKLNLNANAVAAPAQRVASLASYAVATSLRGLEHDTLAPPEMQGGHIGYSFPAPGETSEECRRAYENWILAKGFQDLTRGVRETLEEAYLFIQLLNREPGKTTMEELEAEIAGHRTKAQKMTFPALLTEVNTGLREPMAFADEFSSLQAVRNCLEHRGGRVGERDVDPATRILVLNFPRLKMFYYRNGEEVELAPGEILDTYQTDSFAAGEGVQILMKSVTRSREYAFNDPVVVLASDFFEIAMACHMFAADVATKLPSAPATKAETDVAA